MSDEPFKDHFSRRARDYARSRPEYPETLFEQLAALCPVRQRAWDCGTGNGQAAIHLTRHFDRVPHDLPCGGRGTQQADGNGEQGPMKAGHAMTSSFNPVRK